MDLVTVVLIGVACFIAAYIFLDRICKCIQYVAVCRTFSECAKASGSCDNVDKEMRGFMGDIMNFSKGKNNGK